MTLYLVQEVNLDKKNQLIKIKYSSFCLLSINKYKYKNQNRQIEEQLLVN
jgi:hypothetical protein